MNTIVNFFFPKNEMDKSKPVLYYYYLSSCSWRVRIALAYKEIDYDLKPIDDPSTAEYLAINPLGQVPTLEVDGYCIAESMAILEYLEERYPEKPLLPKNLMDRSKVRQISELIVSGIQPLQNPSVAEKYSEDEEKQLEWTRFYINKGFVALETILNEVNSGGKYSYGNTLTIADCCLAPQVYNAIERFNIDMKSFPKILSIYKELIKLDEVKLGRPDQHL